VWSVCVAQPFLCGITLTVEDLVQTAVRQRAARSCMRGGPEVAAWSLVNEHKILEAMNFHLWIIILYNFSYFKIADWECTVWTKLVCFYLNDPITTSNLLFTARSLPAMFSIIQSLVCIKFGFFSSAVRKGWRAHKKHNYPTAQRVSLWHAVFNQLLRSSEEIISALSGK